MPNYYHNKQKIIERKLKNMAISEKKVLTAGYCTVINQKTASGSVPIYPYTRAQNVITDSTGTRLSTILASLATATQDATTSQKGIVQLSSTVSSSDEATALTPKGAYDAIAAQHTADQAEFIPYSQVVGAAANTADGDLKIVALGAGDKINATYLPSFVDDVVDVNMSNGSATYAAADDAGHAAGDAVTPEANKIYVDVATNKTYRWSGTAYVEISESLALGTTDATAFVGDKGQAMWTNFQKVSQVVTSETVGDVTTYTHNGQIGVQSLEWDSVNSQWTLGAVSYIDVMQGVDASLLNTTKSDIVSAANDALTAAAIMTKLRDADALATTVVSASQAGIVTPAMYNKFVNTQEIAVSASTPAFASSEGIWFEIVDDETAAVEP